MEEDPEGKGPTSSTAASTQPGKIPKDKLLLEMKP